MDEQEDEAREPALGDEYDYPEDGRRVRLVQPASETLAYRRPCHVCVVAAACDPSEPWGERCGRKTETVFVYVDDIPRMALKGELA